MARSRRAKTANLLPQADPAAPLDSKAFLAAAQPVLALLTDDLLERAEAHPDVTAELRDTHTQELAARRTGESFEAWRRGRMVQVAAAWLLSCVFVRVLEDRGLLAHHRLAGPGAEDSQRQFGELAPYLGARDYLLTVFRELTRIPATAPLFDARHNLVWRLAPSHGAAQALLDLLRAPQADAPAFRFGQSDTTFLGDLYQDISEDVRKTFALLQTPPFVQSFILDRTLEPALAEFGLDDTKLIDPTCGSGHFLLGAFTRLLDHQRREHPGLPEREHALRAIRAVYGIDLNPYAVAIARFRLTLTFWEAVGLRRLDRHSAQPPLNVVVGDSLLLAAGEQKGLHEIEGQAASNWLGAVFSFDDEAVAKRILAIRFEAVVGNPPYITVKDAVLRDEYRRLYPNSASGAFALSAPFLERFFQLARLGGFSGQITSNSFTKRDFGIKLVENVLSKLALELVVNAAGVYIPGHGTPTVLIFGRNQLPSADSKGVLAVLSKRGEPSLPSDPAKGAVWMSVLGHWHEVGYDGDYISVEIVSHKKLGMHPWSLEGGGATALKAMIESRGVKSLGDISLSIGRVAHTGADEAYVAERKELRRFQILDDCIADFVEGEMLRDWAMLPPTQVVFPYDKDALVQLADLSDNAALRHLWRNRTMLWGRREPQGTHREIGFSWYQFSRFHPERFRGLGIAFSFIATHNHFVLDRGDKVFKQSAPVIKLHPGADEDVYLALLAYLNSSTVCFWLKQVTYPKGTPSHDIDVQGGSPENNRYEFPASAVSKLPLPGLPSSESFQALAAYARSLETLRLRRDELVPETVVLRLLAASAQAELSAEVSRAKEDEQEVLEQMVAVQEDLDWAVYEIFGLLDDCSLSRRWSVHARLAIRARPFVAEAPPAGSAEPDRVLWQDRKQAIAKSRNLHLLENPVNKRRWWGARGVFASKVATYEDRAIAAARDYVADRLEVALGSSTVILGMDELALQISAEKPVERALGFIHDVQASASPIPEILERESIPFLAAWRYTEDGMANHAHWEHTWALQRREDAGEAVGEIPVPPKYEQEYFRDANFYRLRGKLDVPKERFISYPGCESGQDGEAIYGWAGWDHLQRADALADLFYKRKDGEDWKAERLTPILAGLLELLPWLKQWHNEPNAEGHRMGDVYSDVIDEECRALGLTREKLREWRPAAGRRRGASATSEAGKRGRSPTADRAEPGESETAEPAPAKRGRKPKAAPTPVEPAPAPTPIEPAPAPTPATTAAAEPGAPPKRRGRPPKAAAAPLSLFPAEPPPAEAVPARPRGRAKE